jgi:hypothetical protein
MTCEEIGSGKHQRSAITDQQFETSLARYPYQSVARIDKDIEKRMFQIADRRLRIAAQSVPIRSPYRK